jgi:hypothetical protein
VGQAAIHQVAGGLIEDFAQQRSDRAKDWPANANDRFNPRVLRRFLQKDDRAKKGYKHGRAHFQAEPFGRQQVSALVNKDQQDKSNREPNSPKHGVNPNRYEHGAAGFQHHPAVLQDEEQGEFELGEQRDNTGADRPQRLLQLLAEAGPRRRRWRETVLGMFVLIHVCSLPESVRPASFFPNPNLNLNLFSFRREIKIKIRIRIKIEERHGVDAPARTPNNERLGN